MISWGPECTFWLLEPTENKLVDADKFVYEAVVKHTLHSCNHIARTELDIIAGHCSPACLVLDSCTLSHLSLNN